VAQVVVGILAEDIPGVADHCNRLDMIAGVAGDGANGVQDHMIFPDYSGLTCG